MGHSTAAPSRKRTARNGTGSTVRMAFWTTTNVLPKQRAATTSARSPERARTDAGTDGTGGVWPPARSGGDGEGGQEGRVQRPQEGVVHRLVRDEVPVEHRPAEEVGGDVEVDLWPQLAPGDRLLEPRLRDGTAAAHEVGVGLGERGVPHAVA